jgi:uncharacterized SAM-binding protein YcdF (DUF218 family)
MKSLAVIFLLWTIGLIIFFTTIPRHVVDTQTYTEAVVVLTGGRERLKTGFKLLCANQAKTIFISGVHPGETLKTLLKTIELSAANCLLDRDEIIASTYLGYLAKNTKENAQETAAWVNQMNIDSIRLVTAAYHMPRSLMQLKYLLPQVTIIPHPVFPFGQERYWWSDVGAIHVILSEYHKFLLGYLRILFLPKDHGNE